MRSPKSPFSNKDELSTGVLSSPAAKAASSKATPMLKQYREVKAKHKDCILFFRLGDFYEMFFEDAKTVSRELELVLTSRGKGPSQKIPMCGFPHHASENYIARLIKAGFKVAICEQLEDPALAKGIVKRDVTRIISSGTFLDENSTESRVIACLSINSDILGLAFSDPSSGTIHTNQYPFRENLTLDLISNLPICECLFPESQKEKFEPILKNTFFTQRSIVSSPLEDWSFNKEIAQKTLCDHFAVHNLHGFGIEDAPEAISASGALLEYLKHMNKQPLKHMDKISLYDNADFVMISPAAYQGLECDRLIKTLNFTCTAMGKRKFRHWFLHPLKNVAEIKNRQEAIRLLKESPQLQTELKAILNKIPDLEKNISRLSCGYTHAKDLLAIRNTLNLIPQLRSIIEPLVRENDLYNLEDIPELRTFLTEAISEDIPLSHPEGKVIHPGFHKELDVLRDLQENSRQLLRKMQAQEIKSTGINSLKIGFNKVFGYYIEVTKTNTHAVPENYIRKQTLVNAERYITPQLKEFEEKILTAQEKIAKIENELIKEIQQRILENSLLLHTFCDQVATLDVNYSLSELAQSPRYCTPTISEDTTLDIKEGRHPVVENTAAIDFVPNDTLLDCNNNHLIILTGPNMAGKSTYIRQTAILVIMAQVGSFIPAKSAHIGLVDKIFTRIGAHDDITKGQSTFMVEMNEAAEILNNLSERSLVILDEIGRGTSTFDGLSLAWALAEHLQDTKARTLFATHFHELTALADERSGVKNFNVSVKEWKDEVIFLHKIVEGSSDDSYGIYVAKLAGIPAKVINRAKHILTHLELKNDLKENLKENSSKEKQISFFTQAAQDPVLEEITETLKAMDINDLKPLDALNKLQEMKEKVEGKNNV